MAMIGTSVSQIKEESSDVRDCQSLSSNRNVLGALLEYPALLEDSGLSDRDFPEITQKLIFAAIQNIALQEGLDVPIPSQTIIEFYTNYPGKFKTLQINDAYRMMENARESADIENFAIHCLNVKKYTLLRALKKKKFDITHFYNPDAELIDIQEIAQDNFRKSSIDDILKYYQDGIDVLEKEFNSSADETHFEFGDEHLDDQLAVWAKGLNQGYGYASKYLTSVTHGIKPGKFFIVSAGTGVGKTRMMLANLCYSFLPKFWNEDTKQWETPDSGGRGKALYIGTEMDPEKEVQGMILSYMCGVEYDKIVNNTMNEEEKARVYEGRKFIDPEVGVNSGIFIVDKPNFNMSWLRKTIRKYKREHNIDAVFFDYMYSSGALKSEYSQLIGKNGQYAEHQALQELSVSLKELANDQQVYIETATQVSGEWHDYKKRDSDIVRGAKGVIDKADRAAIFSNPEEKELELITQLRQDRDGGSQLINKYEPNRCLTIYKNRDGRYNAVKIWLYFDTATMRMHDLFCTNCEVDAIIPIRKVRSIFNPVTNSIVSMNLDEAKEAEKAGIIDKATYNQFAKMEKADPSFKGKRTRKEDKALKEMENATNEVTLMTELLEPNYDDDDFNF